MTTISRSKRPPRPTRADLRREIRDKQIEISKLKNDLKQATHGLAEAAEILTAAGMPKAARRFREASTGDLGHFDEGLFDIPF